MPINPQGGELNPRWLLDYINSTTIATAATTSKWANPTQCCLSEIRSYICMYIAHPDVITNEIQFRPIIEAIISCHCHRNNLYLSAIIYPFL